MLDAINLNCKELGRFESASFSGELLILLGVNWWESKVRKR